MSVIVSCKQTPLGDLCEKLLEKTCNTYYNDLSEKGDAWRMKTDTTPGKQNLQGEEAPTMNVLGEYWVTAAFVIINVLVYLILEIGGDTEDAYYMMEHGAIYPTRIVENGEYWRLLTATFMHFGFMHLFNNMIILITAGQILEKAIGHWKYLFLYVLAGIGGSSLSYLQMLHSGDYAVVAGASGAIFGIIGALLWIVIIHKGRYETLTGKGLIIMIVLCLYYGISSGGVDNWGHIGGLLGGFVLGILLYRKKSRPD